MGHSPKTLKKKEAVDTQTCDAVTAETTGFYYNKKKQHQERIYSIDTIAPTSAARTFSLRKKKRNHAESKERSRDRREGGRDKKNAPRRPLSQVFSLICCPSNLLFRRRHRFPQLPTVPSALLWCP